MIEPFLLYCQIGMLAKQRGDRPEQERARREAEEVVARRRRYRPQLVLVFGSRARGEALAESGLDLLVVSDRFRGMPFLEQASTLLADLDLPFAADVLCYTPEELARKRREHGIVSLALEGGVAL